MTALFSLKRFCTILSFLSLAATGRAQDYEQQRNQLVGDVAAAVEKAGRKKVATLDFCDLQGRVSELGRFLSEEVSIGLVLKKGASFVVVDRANLNRIMAEHKLTMSGLMDPENTKKLGQFSGADALITGTITDLGNEIVLSIKVTSTDTAEVLGGARAKLAKSPELKKLLEKDIVPGDEPARKPVPDAATQTSGNTPSDMALAKQRIRYVEVSLLDVTAHGSEVTATIRFRAPKGFAVALKAEHSDGIADFWKFFPKPQGFIKDGMGNTGPLSSATGLGFAREASDRLVVNRDEDAVATLSFSECRSFNSNTGVTISFEIWLDYWEGDQVARSMATVSLASPRKPKGK